MNKTQNQQTDENEVEELTNEPNVIDNKKMQSIINILATPLALLTLVIEISLIYIGYHILQKYEIVPYIRYFDFLGLFIGLHTLIFYIKKIFIK